MKTRSKQNWLLTAWCSILLLFGCTLAGLAQQNQGFVPIGFLQPGGSGTSNPVTAAQGGTGSAANTGATGKILRGDGDSFEETPYTIPGTAGGNGTVSYWNGTNLVTSTTTFPFSNTPSAGNWMIATGSGTVGYAPYNMPTSISGTGTILRTAGSSAIVESTATYPDTVGSGTILRASSANMLAASAYTMPATAGAAGLVATSDGTNIVMSAPPCPIAPTNATNFATAKATIPFAETSYVLSGFPSSMTVNYSGTKSNLSDATGRYISCTSAASTGGDADFETATTANAELAGGARYYWHIKTGSSISVCRLQIGMSSVIGTATNSDDPTTNLVVFRYSPATDGTAFWRIGANDNSGGGTYTTTTFPIAASTEYWLCIDTADPANIAFYINGTNVGTVSSNLPSTTQDMNTFANLRTLENVAKTLVYGSHIIQQR